MNPIYVDQAEGAIELELIAPEELPDQLNARPESERRWLEDHGLSRDGVRWAAVSGEGDGLRKIVAVSDASESLWAAAGLPLALPEAVYRISRLPDGLDARLVALGWGLGNYQFNRYRQPVRGRNTLVVPDGVDGAGVRRDLEAVSMVRDLINTPTEDLGPEQLSDHARQLAERHAASITEIIGDDLLKNNFPAIHVVGRASHRPPRLIDLRWGDSAHPRVTLVGKGVCFDTGGLDLKNSAGMRLMKKDMGGAAHVLGLAHLIMDEGLPVNLRVLVPAVENAVGPDAYRPGDIIPTRKGLSVEVGNTDAEGRVILSDALTLACEENPELLIDFATLTGAARVALGTDLPAFFCNQDGFAEGVLTGGECVTDPVWRMPLYAPYRKLIEPNHADLSNSGVGRFGGAITAALFLQAFVSPEVPWGHIDTYGWNERVRPGRPLGGESLGLRAVAEYLRQRYG